MKKIYIFIPLLLFLTACFLLIWNKNLYDDEYPHYEQIKVFLEGDTRIVRGLSKLPGYPLAVAILGGVFDLERLPTLRLVSFGFSLGSVVMFFVLAKAIDGQSSLVKTLQYAFIPVQFPYLFLLYSEGLSNLLVFLILYLVLKKRYFYAGLMGLVAVFVRQTNIIWLGFFFVLGYLEEFGFRLDWREVVSYLKRSYIFVLTGVIFVLFVILNKGVAVRDQPAMPSFQIHTEMIYWTVFLLFVLFLPIHLTKISRLAKKIIKNPSVVLPGLLFGIIMVLTYNNLHPQNTSWEHLHNRVLLLFSEDLLRRAAFFIFVSLGILFLSIEKLMKKSYYLFYPFAFLSLLPFWLVASRYSLVPIVLFLLFRKKESNTFEYLILSIFIFFSLIFFAGYLRRDFYL